MYSGLHKLLRADNAGHVIYSIPELGTYQHASIKVRKYIASVLQ